MLMRKELFKGIKQVVVKVGTAVLTSPSLGLDAKRIEKIVDEVVELRRNKMEVVLVTSGSIGAGMKALGLKEKPRTLPGKQAAAAIGQIYLMHLYERFFRKKGYLSAQILLTQDDLTDRRRYLNARHTLKTLLRLKVIPIINENDSVGVEEIKFGDNDTLSALVSNLLDAELLIILSNIDGLYEFDPRKKKGGKPICQVEKIDSGIEKLAGGPGETTSTGGMYTKLQAAQIVTDSGEFMVIANGKTPHVIRRILEGEEIGTLFLPKKGKITSRKRWIAFTRKSCGKIFVDVGAKEVLKLKGKSLLPSGILKAEGDFKEGDMVSIIGPDGKEFARGLSNYSSHETGKVKGIKTKEIQAILGYKYYDEIIHRDNLVIL